MTINFYARWNAERVPAMSKKRERGERERWRRWKRNSIKKETRCVGQRIPKFDSGARLFLSKLPNGCSLLSADLLSRSLSPYVCMCADVYFE